MVDREQVIKVGRRTKGVGGVNLTVPQSKVLADHLFSGDVAAERPGGHGPPFPILEKNGFRVSDFTALNPNI